MKYTHVNIKEDDYVSWRFFRSGKNSRTFHRPAATHPKLRLFAVKKRHATNQNAPHRLDYVGY